MLHAGIIGLGKMGLSHAAILNPHPDVELVGVCDTSSIVLEAFKKFSTIRVYDDYKKMIDTEKPDLLIVASPTKYHYEMVSYALDRGIHTFCEKPFSLTTREGRDLVNKAADKGVVNQVGFHNHFIGTFRELKRLLKAGILGELVHFTGEAYGPVVVREKGETWRSDPKEGGGCLFDYASHVINLIQEIIGLPVTASGSQLKKIYSKKVEDAVYSILTLDSGVTGVLSANWSDETYRKMSTSLMVMGKKGKIICDATELKIYLKEANERENLEKGWTIKYITDLAIPVNFYLRGEEYSAQIDHFIQCVLKNKQSEINSFAQALKTDETIDLIIEDSKR
ncbi:MAG: Gfo/Idh/MocA family oxidoreductase [Bacteroidales bacterium]|jgi:predicted dehydrogenase|nr:Gfo/Idh/MocA family oxidoreductase [Bacteroidales bacterium]HQK69254.1 Gfo/Idh/MocA family oxidoreductase [Bacteroidales bacterium]